MGVEERKYLLDSDNERWVRLAGSLQKSTKLGFFEYNKQDGACWFSDQVTSFLEAEGDAESLLKKLESEIKRHVDHSGVGFDVEFTWSPGSTFDGTQFNIHGVTLPSPQTDIVCGTIRSLIADRFSKQISRVLEYTPGVIFQFVLNPDGSTWFPFLSDKALDIFGVPPSTLVTSKTVLRDFCHPDEYDDLVSTIQESARNLSIFLWEGRMIGADGGERWLHCESLPELHDDGSILWDGIFLDITWKKVIEKRLSDREQTYKQMLDAIPDLIVLKDRESRILWANKAICDYYASNAKQLAWRIDGDHVRSELTKAYMEDDRWVFENAAPLNRSEEFVQSANGELRPFETIKAPIFNSEGKVELLVSVSRDISERKRYEQRIERERLKALLAARMATLGEMAGGIAHEINNPLTVIVGKAKQISKLLERSPLDVKLVDDAAKLISETANRISEIVRSMHIIARDSSNDPYVMTELGVIIRETMTLCKTRFISAGIDVQMELPDEEVMVECNPGRISQVLLNVLNNAYAAVVASDDDKWVKVSATQLGSSEVRISVADNGPGIPAEEVDKIMLPFYTTKEPGKGIGLGLSISTTIAEEHGGRLYVECSSSPTCFTLQLPINRHQSI